MPLCHVHCLRRSTDRACTRSCARVECRFSGPSRPRRISAARRLFTGETDRPSGKVVVLGGPFASRMVIVFSCNAFSPLRRRSGTSDRSSPIVRAMNSDGASVAPLAELIRLARLPLAHATDDLARRVSAAARRISTSAWNNPRVLVPSLRAVCASPPLTPLWHTSRIVHCSDLHCCCQTLPRCENFLFFVPTGIAPSRSANEGYYCCFDVA